MSQESQVPELEVGAPFFLDGRRAKITSLDRARIKFAGNGWSGTAARADVAYDPEFEAFHLVGRLHKPVRKNRSGALQPTTTQEG